MKKNLLQLGVLALLLMVSASAGAWTIDFKALGAKYQDKTGVTISEAVAANVGTVSIVNGNLIVGEGEEAATASEDLYGNFALQTGTTWLIRPGGLYQGNGGGRAFGILNCKKDQNITIDVNVAPTLTTSNAELKSNEGSVYVYTVLEDGDVLFNLARYNYIASISVNWDIDFAALGAKYVDKTGVTISEAVDGTNVGSVSIVNGTLITPIDLEDETQQTTDSDVLDPSFALQTGTNWLIRPAGLYQANGGGRAFGILNCKKDQIITIDVTAEPSITSGNAELKSKEGNVYVYTVTEDGHVLFNLARYNTIANVAVGDLAGVEYTVKFVNEEGETIKNDAVHKGEIGTVVELTASDLAPIYTEDGTIKYVFKEADNTETNLIKEDGSTVVTAVFRKADIYYAVLNCKAGSETLYQFRDLEKYWFFEGDKYYLYPSRAYKGKDGSYYFTPATTWNGVVFEFPGAAITQTGGGKTYYIGTQTYDLVDTVAYYSDIERLALPVEDAGYGTGLGQLVGEVAPYATAKGEQEPWYNWTGGLWERFSQGRGIRLGEGSYVYTEPIAEAATYKVTLYGRNDNSNLTQKPALGLRDASGDVQVYTELTIPAQGTGTTGAMVIEDVAIPAGSSLIIMNDGEATFLSLDDISLAVSGEYVAPVTVGIQNVEKAQQNGVIYNLAGQAVKAVQKGLYIKNGKKYIVK